MKKRNYILIACAVLLGLAFTLAPFSFLAHADEVISGGDYGTMAINPTMIFDSQGGSAVASLSAPEGEEIYAPTPPTKAGYTFDGWWSAASGGYQITFPHVLIENITVYAHWTESTTEYTITFDSQGGSSVPSQSIVSGSYCYAPTPPTKSGNAFTGWWSAASGGTKQTFPFIVAADKTLYAQWTKSTSEYTITFDSQGGSSVPSQSIGSGGEINEPMPPTKSGYTFNGWWSAASDGTQQTFPFTVAADKTLYAHWTEIPQYTITFDSQGGSSVPSQTVVSGTSISAPTPPTRSGYTFDGWYSSSSGGTKQTFPFTVTANKTLYAQWIEVSPTQYTVTFSSDGGSYISPITVNAGMSIDSPIPTKNGFTFLGWFTSASEYGVKVEFPYTPTANIILNAKWESIIPQYTIRFHANYGVFSTGFSEALININVGSFVYSAPIATRKGFTFLGWFTEPIGGVQITFPYMPLSHTTIYAQWAVYEPFDGGFEILLQQIFSAFGTISAIELYPNITIGILIGFPLILAALFVLFKFIT